jgi:hypothetical protein
MLCIQHLYHSTELVCELKNKCFFLGNWSKAFFYILHNWNSIILKKNEYMNIKKKVRMYYVLSCQKFELCSVTIALNVELWLVFMVAWLH